MENTFCAGSQKTLRVVGSRQLRLSLRVSRAGSDRGVRSPIRRILLTVSFQIWIVITRRTTPLNEEVDREKTPADVLVSNRPNQHPEVPRSCPSGTKIVNFRDYVYESLFQWIILCMCFIIKFQWRVSYHNFLWKLLKYVQNKWNFSFFHVKILFSAGFCIQK